MHAVLSTVKVQNHHHHHHQGSLTATIRSIIFLCSRGVSWVGGGGGGENNCPAHGCRTDDTKQQFTSRSNSALLLKNDATSVQWPKEPFQELLTSMFCIFPSKAQSPPADFFLLPSCCFFCFLESSWSIGAGRTNFIISFRPKDRIESR